MVSANGNIFPATYAIFHGQIANFRNERREKYFYHAQILDILLSLFGT